MASLSKAGAIDQLYEFEAPKYVDFEEAMDDKSDDWFEQETLKHQNALDNPMNVDDLHGHNTSFSSTNQEPAHFPKTPKLTATNKTRLQSAKRTTQRKSAKKGNPNTSSWQAKLTVPESPMLTTKERARPLEESTDSFQSRQIAGMILEQAKRRRLNSLYRRKAVVSTAYLPARSTKPLTDPQEFRFETDSRLRLPNEPVVENVKPDVTFMKSENGLTIPEPFVFLSEGRIKQQALPTTPFRSFAQKMQMIQEKTPLRFRTKPRGWRPSMAATPGHNSPRKLTHPVTPNLVTKMRHRETNLISTEQREANEMANMPQFHANPLDRRILDSCGQLGISKVSKAPLTQPEEFSLATDARAEARPLQPEPEVFVFKARYLDPNVMHGPAKGIPQVQKIALTVPESPMLATKGRSGAHESMQVEEETTATFKAKPPPSFAAPFAPVLPHKLVVPVPFNLQTEVRGFDAKRQLEEKLLQEEKGAEQARNFRAQGMRVVEPAVHVPDHKHTEPQPFNLLVEKRGEIKDNKWQELLTQKDNELKKNSIFKAHGIHTTATPFEPRKSSKALTIVDDFTLNSNTRALKRQVFETEKNEKAKAAAAAHQEFEEEQRQQEAIRIKEMRQHMVHKAQPVMFGKPFKTHKSEQELTTPATPPLHTKSRRAGRDL